MNKYWQVVRTYLRRPRFWVLGIVYLAIAWWGAFGVWKADAFVGAALASATLASLTCCFIALHLRRQFGSAEARLTPGFAVPHLVVGAVASLLVWVAVPWGQALLITARPGPLIAAYSVAGLSLALTVCWPKAMVVVVALPLGIVWAMIRDRGSLIRPQDSFFSRFLKGDEPGFSALLIGLTVLAYLLAAVYLLRLSDHVFVNDDFLVERPRSGGILGRWENLLLSFRDAVVQRRLARVGHGWWAVERWRIPVAVAWPSLALAATCVLGLMGLGWYFAGNSSMAFPVMYLASVVLLLTPLGPWQLRRQWLSLEMMRPVTRPRFFRELALALAADVVLWASLMSVISIGTVVTTAFFVSPEPYPYIFVFSQIYLALEWGMACFLYGIALVTLRFRYWIPLIATLGFFWCMASLFVVLRMQQPSYFNGNPLLGVSAISAALGLLLACLAYRRWLETDVI